MKRLNLPKERTFTGPASVWKRIFAFIIDMSIINLVILFPFRNILKEILPKTASFSSAYEFLSANPNVNFSVIVISVIASLLAIAYFYMLEKRLNQSVGKILFNISIVSELKELKGWQLLVRNIFLLPIFPFILLWILDPVFMFFNKENQRLSEILSKTKVVERYEVY